MTPKQSRFIAEFVVDGNATAAARRAGYRARGAHVAGFRLLRNVYVAEAIQASQRQAAARLELNRQRVLDGLMEAVETARQQGDPGAMIRAWAEIGRLMGYYQPEVRRVEVMARTGRTISQLEALPDEQLLTMVVCGPQ